MENSVIRKRLNTFRNSKGKLQRVGSEVVMEVLRAWKGWAGCSVEFCREVGLKKVQLATLMRAGKKLVKFGRVTKAEFKEIQTVLFEGLSPRFAYPARATQRASFSSKPNSAHDEHSSLVVAVFYSHSSYAPWKTSQK